MIETHCGVWNARLEQIPTLAERRRVLEEEAPEHLRESIRAHLVTVFTLKKRARMRMDSGSEIMPDE